MTQSPPRRRPPSRAPAPAGAAAGSAAGGGTTGLVVSGAVKAGLLSLASQAAVSMANNKGDLGKTLKDLGSRQAVRNLATAIVTGGVLAGMSLPPTGQPAVASGQWQTMDLLLTNLKAQAATALIDSAINDTDLGDGLQQALIGALLNTVGAEVAQSIGDEFNGTMKTIAHAIAGCALGAAKTGDKGGCAPGAIGAVVGELMAQAIQSSPGMRTYLGSQDNVVYVSGMFAGLAGALTSSDEQAVQVANFTGSNAAANNALSHDELAERARQDAACQDDPGACEIVKRLDAQSAERNEQTRDSLVEASETQNLQTMEELQQQMQGLDEYKRDLERRLASTSDPQERARVQYEINQADNHIRQTANLGKDTLLHLYEQTGNEDYRAAFANLSAATNGNDLGSAFQDLGLAALATRAGSRQTGAAQARTKVVEGALPNAENAVIDATKITGYALDASHPVGGNKAAVFDSALGFNQSNSRELIAKIQEGVRTNAAVLGKADQFGQRFTVDMPITGPNGKTAIVRTAWIFDSGSTTPRLTTLYVK